MTIQLTSSQIEHWPLDKLIPYARNARTHSDAQVAQIAASIREFGFTNPILVDGEAIVSQRTPENADREIARLASGQYFGEIGLLQACPRTATVRISELGPATLFSTDRQGFDAMVRTTGGIKGDLAQAMLRRISARA